MTSRSSTRFSSKGFLKWIVILLIVLAIIGTPMYFLFPQLFSWFVYEFRDGGWVMFSALIFSVIALVIILFVVYKWSLDNDHKDPSPQRNVLYTIGLGAFTLFCIIAIAGSAIQFTYSINASTNKEQPIQYKTIDTEWDVRAPINTAYAQAQFAVGDNPNATLIDNSLRYLPDNEQYSSLTKTRGIIKSYSQIVTQSSDLVGTNTPEVCHIDQNEAKHWLGGSFFNSLGRKIVSTPGHRLSTYNTEDAFGWCEDGTPFIAVPLYRASGALWNTHPVPDGVAVYNGHTGDLEVRESGEGIPGPTLPRVIAERSIEANLTEGGVSDWLFNRHGYRTRDDAGTNIVLAPTGEDNASEFVSKMIPARESEGDNADPITAIATVSAVSPERGQLPVVTIERLGDASWRPDPAIDAKIRSDYSNLPNWQEFSVHEIIPVDSENFVATIGNDQNVRYRVIGRGNLGTLRGQDEGVSTCIYEGRDQEPLQCGQRGGRDGNSIGIEYEDQKDVDPNTDGDTDSAPAGELADMSTQELIDSTRELLDELERRGNN